MASHFLSSAMALLILSARAAVAQLDFGDAPNTYGTLLGSGGPVHQINAELQLGNLMDAEANGQPSPQADGDDTPGNPSPGGVDDEDGVTFPAQPANAIVPWQIGSFTQANVTVKLPASLSKARLEAWVDFNRDGDFLDANEQIFASYEVAQGGHQLAVFTPVNASAGATFARFRLSTAGGLSPGGAATDGEVEDYGVTLVPASPASNVNAHTRAGQVWITWDFAVAAPAQLYEIYRSTTAITDISQGTLVAALYPGEYAALNLVSEMEAAFGAGTANDNFSIPDAAGAMHTLPAGKGLCVDTIRTNGSYYYSVVPHGVTTVGAANRTAGLVASAFNAANVPRPQVQQSGTKNGYPITFYNLWCDGDDNPGAGLEAFPLMANNARRCTPHLLFIMEPQGGMTGAGPYPVSLALHSGDARALMWLPGQPGFINVSAAPQQGYVVALEDKLYQMINGVPNADNTNWTGYVPTFNPFQNFISDEASRMVPQFRPPPGSVIQPYTLNRLNWTLSWLTLHPGLNIDPNRVAIFGHSGGAKGTLLWSRTSPERFSHVNVFSPQIAAQINLGSNLRMFGTSTLPDPTDTPESPGTAVIPGDNLVVAGLTNLTGGPVRFEDLFRLETSVSPQRDLPPMRFYYGLREDNWAMDMEHNWKSEIRRAMEIADTNGTGAVWHWDLRLHGMDKWTLENAAPAACGFTAADFWVPASAAQTRRDDAATAARYRNNESYPAFHHLRSRPETDTPGTINYGTPPAFFDGLHQWVDTTLLDCYDVPPTEGADHRGTWGGHFDWANAVPPSDARAVREAASFWACTLFLTKNTDGAGNPLAAVDECPASLLGADVAIRRAQLFQPPAGTRVHWMNCDQTTRTVLQSGSVTVGADTVVRLPGIAVSKAPAAVRLVAAAALDFGDAPASASLHYPVTLAEDGARHASDAALTLGAGRNLEADGAHHPTALSGAEGDDGLSSPLQWQQESLITLQITVSAACRLDAWVDWARDGQWSGAAADASDRLASSLPLTAGANSLNIFVPTFAAAGPTFARFRVSLGGGLAPTGAAPDGEVEDYALTITAAATPGPLELTYAHDAQSGQDVISWQGNPAYSSQMEHSVDLVTWNTFGLPQGETAGLDTVAVEARFLGNERHFFRLVRRPLVTSPIPLPPAGPELAHQFVDQSFVHGGLARRYRLKLPNNWTPLRSWPLVMMLPGHGQTAESFWNKRSDMFPLANGDDGDADPNDGRILCFAEATSGDRSYAWFCYNDPRPTHPGAGLGWIDDYAFVKTLTDSLLASGLNIDRARLYAAGFSNGSTMAHYIASKADHPFAAFAMIDGGIPYPIHDAPAGTFIPANLPLPAKARPTLINNQIDSTGWPYEGSPFNAPGSYNFGVPSPGALACVARWTVANSFGGSADPVSQVYSAPAPTTIQTLAWDHLTGPTMRVPINDPRPDVDWPAALVGQNGWTAASIAMLPLSIQPRTPAALRSAYPHTIAPDPTGPLARCIVLNGTWTRQSWRSSAANPANEVVLVTLGDGAHNWPEADAPWSASAEVLGFFDAH